MSPERNQERKISRGFALHVRREKAEERRQFHPIPSWETVSGMLELRTYNNDELHELYLDLDNRIILKEFYDTRYDMAVGKGPKRLNRFIRKYTTDKKSKFYNPDLIDKLKPHLHIIRDSFPRIPTRK